MTEKEVIERESGNEGNGNSGKGVVKVEDRGQRSVPGWDEEDVNKLVASADKVVVVSTDND